MTFTIEPMINAGQRHVKLLPDQWTVVTKDHKLSAQWEHTILVTRDGAEVLTLRAEEQLSVTPDDTAERGRAAASAAADSLARRNDSGQAKTSNRSCAVARDILRPADQEICGAASTGPKARGQ